MLWLQWCPNTTCIQAHLCTSDSFYIVWFNTVDIQYKFGFKLQISGVGSKRSTNWATTTGQVVLWFLTLWIMVDKDVIYVNRRTSPLGSWSRSRTSSLSTRSAYGTAKSWPWRLKSWPSATSSRLSSVTECQRTSGSLNRRVSRFEIT